MARRPSVRQLQYLVAVAEQGHFGRAADQCSVTQSTLSAGIRELEEVLGTVVLERDRRTIGLTPIGQDIVARVAFKPTSSIRLGGQTVDVAGHATDVITKGRHDPCVGIRATPIAEAMLAIVLLDHALRQRAQNADVHSSTPVIPASAAE